jgi:hypothetical protein
MTEKPRILSSVVVGVALIVLGVFFLIGQVLRIEIWSFLWPLIIILFGAAFFVGMFAGGPRMGGLAIPGSMFVILGLVLLAHNTFGNWVGMSYAWALFAPGGVGVGLVIQSWYSHRPDLKKAGYTLMALGLILFVCFGVFFELVLSLGAFARSANLVWPVVLIALGVLMIVGRLFNWSRLLDALPPRNSNHMPTPAP